LHVGAFSPTHDFDGVTAKLDHLAELGVNAIELMPLAQYPGDRNWGYDGVFPFAVQDSYGGHDGLRRLVDSAHRKGIAVIVDVVYNHLGPEGNYLAEFGPYFTDHYHTPWGSAMNYDAEWSDGVRNFFLQQARLLLEDYRVDGLRLDAVHAIKDMSAIPFVAQLKELAAEISRHVGRHKILIAELDLNDPKYIHPPAKGGFGLDGQWVDEFHHALRTLMTGERKGYYEDFGGIDMLEKAYRDTYVYNGMYSPYRKRVFGGKADGCPYDQFVIFAQNHDQVGNRACGERLGEYLSVQQLKLAAAAVLLSPYVPLLFMGEEYGEKKRFPYFVSFEEPELNQAIREGRAAEFSGFADEGVKIPDPAARETFESAVLSWETDQDLLDWYKELIRFRRTRPAMQGRARNSMEVRVVGRVLVLERRILNEQVVILMNFGDSAVKVSGFSEAGLRPVLSSSHPAAAAATAVEPWSVLVCELIQ
jgi:maltooligosyltrehalose trehalohydrolase